MTAKLFERVVGGGQVEDANDLIVAARRNQISAIMGSRSLVYRVFDYVTTWSSDDRHSLVVGIPVTAEHRHVVLQLRDVISRDSPHETAKKRTTPITRLPLLENMFIFSSLTSSRRRRTTQ